MDSFAELAIAIENGDVQKLRKLISQNIDINLSHIDDQTPLGVAATTGNLEMVTVLLDAGAEVNVRMLRDGETALMCAAAEGHLEVVKVLVEAGADIAIESAQGDVATSLAIEGGHRDVATYLNSCSKENLLQPVGSLPSEARRERREVSVRELVGRLLSEMELAGEIWAGLDSKQVESSLFVDRESHSKLLGISEGLLLGVLSEYEGFEIGGDKDSTRTL